MVWKYLKKMFKYLQNIKIKMIIGNNKFLILRILFNSRKNSVFYFV